MTKYRTILRVTTFLTAFLGFYATASAQQSAPESQPTMIFGLVGGMSNGLGAIVGGGVQFPLRERIALSFEGGYLTGGQDFSGFGVDVDTHAISVDANGHYRFLLPDTPKFTPYVLGGIGYLRYSASVSVGGFSGEGSTSTTGLNIGGGAMWQASDKWSIRPELKILVADGSNVRFSAAFCYSLGD